MTINRRLFLKASIFTGALITTLTSLKALAEWPKAAFEAKSVDDTLKILFGSAQLIESDQIKIKAPEIAENGRTVPITLSTTIENAESITVLAANNPSPLSASFTFSPNVGAKISTKIKMAKTGDLIAVVKADNKHYVARQEVKITKGGCGGS